MIVAMVAMVMMQPAVDKIVNVIAMRNRLMPAAGAMDMTRFMTFVAMRPRALGRVLGVHFNNMLLDFGPCLVVQMSIMQIVDMVAVLHGKVTAFRAVLVRMLSVCEMVVCRHGILLSFD